MKTPYSLARLIFALFMSLAFVTVGCSDDDDDDDQPTNIVKFQNTTIRGSEEVPANSSQATGTFTGSYNKDTKILTYTITFSGLTPTAMHFHRGDVGVSGPIVIPIGSAPYTSPINAQTPALTADQEAELLAGKYYVNIHSAQFPGGEIRGQVRPQP
ncbi:CHRD domain-containing protein [Rufibacter glacialis]|uniref:CHRD domain-containing protein n=1 Tax=Rufibacter glacialis TaxID=1259555 RepID=A0A5M8QFQ8_9BACT|nr:CHRD domain-containing protein [Rufibacter glacialis]KAA6434829.1 CHRD domain-containing protein [Rufibacter glacialis]GGK72782.1 hypothetical protein GCM10011405_21270 [Rufibacter glacialis]